MKNSKRILSLFLAVLMMLSVVVALPVIAADDDDATETEGDQGPAYVLEQDFEGYAEGAVLTTNSDAPTGTGVGSDIPADNAVRAEETADGTNKYLHIPYTGHCDVTSGGTPGVNMTGNADRNYILKHDAVSYTDARYGVIEIDYRWEGDGTDARFECQFKTASSAEGSINWVTLFFLYMGNDKYSTYLQTGATRTGVKAADPIDGQWNRFKLVFDLEEGTYDIYVNDVLYAYDGVFAQDGHTKHTNITLNKDQFIAVKPNKCVNTYSEDRPGKDPDSVYVDIDNIKMYSVDDLVRINYDGRGMMVQQGQRLDFGTAGKTFVYAKITDEATSETVYSTEPHTIIDKPYSIETVMLDGIYTVYEGFDAVDDVTGVTAKDFDSITGAPDAVLETMTLVEDFDEVTGYNNYLKIPFAETLDKKQMTFKGEGIDSEKVPVAIFEGKYCFSQDAKGTVAARLKSVNYINDKGVTKEATNIQLFKFVLDGSGSAVLSDVGSRIGDAQYFTLQAGEWYSIRVVINLLSGTYKTYINDVPYAENGYVSTDGDDDKGYRNISIPADVVVPMYFTGDAVAEGSYIAIDDIGLRHGPTVTFRFDNGLSNDWYTEYVDTVFSLKQRGMIFSKATIYTPLDEDEWYELLDEEFNPVLDDNEQPVMVTESQEEIFDEEIVIKEEYDGARIVAEYILTVAEDNFDDPEENPGDAIVAEGQVSEGVAILNANEYKTVGLTTPMMTDENGPYVFAAKVLLKDAASSIKITAKDDRVAVTEPVELFVLNGVDADEPAWAEVKVIIDIENNAYVVYVNDEKVKDGAIDAEFVLAENGITVEYFGETDAAIDDMILRYKKIFKITVDGAKVEVEENQIFSTYDADRMFAYAYVCVNGTDVDEEGNEITVVLDEFFLTETAVMVQEGMVINRHYVDKFEMMDASARLGSPTGLRFVSTISKDAISTFRYSEDGNDKRNFSFGTIIVPAEYLDEITGKVTKEKLIEKYGADGILDVAGVSSPSPKWYSVTGLSPNLQAFAGSIANVKTENLARKFVGIGYVTFTLEDGQVVTLYANYNESGESLSDVAEATLDEQGEKLSPLMKTTLEAFVVTAD